MTQYLTNLFEFSEQADDHFVVFLYFHFPAVKVSNFFFMLWLFIALDVPICLKVRQHSNTVQNRNLSYTGEGTVPVTLVTPL